MRIIMLIFSSLIFNQAYGSNVRTNINEVTTYLNDNVINRKTFESEIDTLKNNALDQSHNGQGLQYITDNPSSIIPDNNHLTNTSAHDLESLGRQRESQEIAKDVYSSDIFIDYTNPSNIAHLKDLNALSDHSAKFMSNFLNHLKDLGILCKEIDGNKLTDVTFSVQVSKEQQRDTVYNQFFCEELKNRYTCMNSLVTKCAKKGIRFKDWQEFELDVNGPELFNRDSGIFFPINWKKHRTGYELRLNKRKRFEDSNYYPQEYLHQYIAQTLNVSLDQIEVKGSSGRGLGEPFCLRCEGKMGLWVWNLYKVRYLYRDIYEVCEEWSDQWVEHCKLY